jgi:hypothetical protein
MATIGNPPPRPTPHRGVVNPTSFTRDLAAALGLDGDRIRELVIRAPVDGLVEVEARICVADGDRALDFFRQYHLSERIDPA